MDTQNILRTIHRNQEQIDLLTANNTQLIEFLMVAGAQAALTSLEHSPAPAGSVPIWHQIAEQNLTRSLPLPPATTKKRMGRPPGGKNRPKQEPDREVRYDTMGRKIHQHLKVMTAEQRKAVGEASRRRWEIVREAGLIRPGSPARSPSNAEVARAQKIIDARKKRATSKQGTHSRDKSPQAVAEWKRKLSEANRRARAKKAAMGIDYTTNQPIEKGGAA
jgi:hypothetical protein